MIAFPSSVRTGTFSPRTNNATAKYNTFNCTIVYRAFEVSKFVVSMQ